MLIRIVRLTFKPEATEQFLAMFHNTKERIRNFEGCHHLELWQDQQKPNVMTTCSHWQSAEALEAYRMSDLFQTTWKQTKILFADKPQAHSYQQAVLVEGNN